jgi:hypothetical protein
MRLRGGIGLVKVSGIIGVKLRGKIGQRNHFGMYGIQSPTSPREALRGIYAPPHIH